jgi:hypothetical protein
MGEFCIQIFWSEKFKGRSGLKALRVNWRIISNFIGLLKKYGGRVWNGFRITGQWWTLVKMVVNLRAPYKTGNVLPSSSTISFSGRTLSYGVSKFDN